MPKGSGGRVSSTKQKWIPKGSEKQAGKKGKENEEGAAQAGPKYDRNQLLRTYGTCKDDGALLVLQETNSMDEAPKELRYTTEARPEEESTSRKGSKEQKVESSEERRPSTQLLVKELVTEGTEATTPVDPAMITYLQSMVSAASAFGLPGMYGAVPYPGYTTVMLRNIPNRYTRDMLINRLDKGYEGLYDFVYLPIDFSSRCNVGYAFINFRTPSGAQRFMQEFHGAKTKHCLPGFGSAKVAEVSFARVQGREQNMENLRDEKFIEKLLDRTEWQPLFLDDDGKEIPFSKAFEGVSGEKRRNSKKMVAPPYIPPSTPTGFMKPPPYFPAPTNFSPQQTPPVPSMLASLLSANKETLLMLRGVPVKYTRQQFIDVLKSKCGSDFNFVFLPEKAEKAEKADAQNEGPCNRGFAFVNFKSAEQAKKFSEDFVSKQISEYFPEGELEKACEVQPARLETLEKSIERCQSAVEKDEDNQWLPVLIEDDGEVKKFPMLAEEKKEKAQTDDANAAPADKAPEGEPKTKAKGNRKGKDGTPTGAPPGYPYPFGVGYPGYFGYPGYPGYSPYQVYTQMAAAQNARAIQAAQLQARAKAAGRKGGQKGFHQNVLDPLAAAVNLKGDEQLSDDGRDRLRSQVEFYFSTNNLCKDLFLRQHMEPEGWTSLELISQFPMVRRFKVSLPTLIEVVSESSLFEIDKDAQKLRLANESERKKWAQAPVPLEYKVPA